MMLILAPARSRWSPVDLAAAAVAGGVDAVQVRMPNAAPEETRAVAFAVAARVGDRAVVLVNGSDDLAAALGLGLHLPERAGPDAAANARRRLAPGSLVGQSVHASAAAAAGRGADYLLAGHVFPTASHPGEPPLGIAGLARIVAAAPCPVLAVGGIDENNAAAVVAAGARGAAVIGAIADATDPKTAARRLRAAIDRALEEQATMATTEHDRSAPATGVTGAADLSLTVNGKPLAIPSGSTVRDFLASKGLADGMAIVERNGKILPRAAYGTVLLADGDRLEVVHAVGGG